MAATVRRTMLIASAQAGSVVASVHQCVLLCYPCTPDLAPPGYCKVNTWTQAFFKKISSVRGERRETAAVAACGKADRPTRP